MKTSSAAALAVIATLGFFHSSANAAVPIAYVDSAAGNDANAPNCLRTAPCRTMAVALANITNPGLVVVVADSEFAPFTITTGGSVSCPGVACIVNSSGGATGITIAAGVNETVVLTGVSVVGFGSGGTGVNVTSAGKVELNRATISGNSVGLNFSPTSGSSSHLFMNDSEVRYSTGRNVNISPTSAVNVQAVITGSRIHHGVAGIVADATTGGSGISLLLAESTVNNHSNNGVAAVANGSGCPGTPSGPFARIQIVRSAVSFTATAVNSIGCSAQFFLDSNMITQATTGISASGGGFVQTTTNNAVSFNTTNVSGPINHIAPQ